MSHDDLRAFEEDLARDKAENNSVVRATSNRKTGGSTHYYELPPKATQLHELIHHKGMSHSIGEAFSALYRLNDNGEFKRNLEKVVFYAQLELGRLDK